MKYFSAHTQIQESSKCKRNIIITDLPPNATKLIQGLLGKKIYFQSQLLVLLLSKLDCIVQDHIKGGTEQAEIPHIKS